MQLVININISVTKRESNSRRQFSSSFPVNREPEDGISVFRNVSIYLQVHIAL
jgi:hypothetical protein